MVDSKSQTAAWQSCRDEQCRTMRRCMAAPFPCSSVSETIARGRVVRLPYINRAMVRTHPDVLFVFGDNMEGRGMGGQAREMRGEPNVIGVPTKWAPERIAAAYFTDDDRMDRNVWHAINGAFEEMRKALASGRNVVIPTDGLGTGLAELQTRAPKLHAMIEAAIASLGGQPAPASIGQGNLDQTNANIPDRD